MNIDKNTQVQRRFILDIIYITVIIAVHPPICLNSSPKLFLTLGSKLIYVDLYDPKVFLNIAVTPKLRC